jgi:L-2,4-diaminobutyrate decarboxylase
LWQPLACGLFLVACRADLEPLEVRVDYLDADSGEEPEPVDASEREWRMPHLVSSSLATSRRFDALKVLLTFRALGVRTVGALLDRSLELAARAAELVEASPRLALAHRPGLNMVVFRFVPERDEPSRSDRINAAIRVRLLADGSAVVGRTAVRGRTHLKLSLLNPLATGDDLARLVGLVVRTGAELEEPMRPWDPPEPRRPGARLAGRRRLPHHRRVMSLCRNARFTGDRVPVLEARVRT